MNNKGISLLSLSVTIIVIIIIAAISIRMSSKNLEEANQAKFEVALKTVVETLEAYNQRAEIRGIKGYNRNLLAWDGVSERAENTARIEDKTKEDTIRFIMSGYDIPESLEGIMYIESGKVKIDEDKKPQYDWAVDMYSYMAE